jgi:N-acyl-D-amino-acid deacylase
MKKLLKLFLFVTLLTSCKGHRHYDTIIHQVFVVDGSGKPGFLTDVALNNDSIARVGDLSDASANEVIEAKGLVLTPGFIDTHSHHDRGMENNRSMLAAVSQGITTIVVGQDGSSALPLDSLFQALEKAPIAVNLASYAGHNSIREKVLESNFKRKATNAEVSKMKVLLEKEMRAGALGLSTGLEYDPGIYSSPEEVLQLASVLPAFNGRYISHLRSEDRYFWDALQELIQIGRQHNIPVQVSHFKLAMKELWGKADSALAILERARQEGIRVTADVYPYEYWSSTITVLFPNRNFSDLREATYILKNVTTAEGIIFSEYDPNPEYNGKNLAEVAIINKLTNEQMLVEAIEHLVQCRKIKDCGASIVATSMHKNDIIKIMRWSQSSICSDGANAGRHPRGFGAFTRVLDTYVKQEKALTLPQAIQKMTSLSAEQMGFEKRGKIAPGYFADLVLMDTAHVKDRSTIKSPQQTSEGINRVWVNGRTVYVNQKPTGVWSGKVIRREMRSPQKNTWK